jgi:tRNA(fMet)-specific endonuclease VapC
MKLVIDTNAYSDYLRGSQRIADQLNRATVVYMPVIVLGELKRGFYNGQRIDHNVNDLQKFLTKSIVRVLSVTEETAELYGRLATYLKQKGQPIPVNDIWIAALCLQHDAALLTNDSDFQYLPQITVIPTS